MIHFLHTLLFQMMFLEAHYISRYKLRSTKMDKKCILKIHFLRQGRYLDCINMYNYSTWTDTSCSMALLVAIEMKRKWIQQQARFFKRFTRIEGQVGEWDIRYEFMVIYEYTNDMLFIQFIRQMCEYLYVHMITYTIIIIFIH